MPIEPIDPGQPSPMPLPFPTDRPGGGGITITIGGGMTGGGGGGLNEIKFGPPLSPTISPIDRGGSPNVRQPAGFLPLPPGTVPAGPPGTPPPPDVPRPGPRPIPRPVPGVPPFIRGVIFGGARASIITGSVLIGAIVLRDLILGRQDRAIDRMLADQDRIINDRLDELRRRQLITEPFVGPAPGSTPVGTATGSGRRVRPYITRTIRDITRPGTSGISPTAPRPRVPPPPTAPEIPLPEPQLPAPPRRPEIDRPTIPQQSEPAPAPAPTRPSPPTQPVLGRIVDFLQGIFGTAGPAIGGIGTGTVLRSALARPGLTTSPGVAPTTPTQPAQPDLTTATAQAVGAGVRAPTTTADCAALERTRKPGRCREGFFVERAGRPTKFTTWREKECATGITISEK